jgi:hypothetical protein
VKQVLVDGRMELHADEHFSRWEIELWLIRRIAKMAGSDPDSTKAQVFGDVRFEQRQRRIHDLILKYRLQAQAIGNKPEGGTESFAEFYARFYGAPLKPKDP